MFLDGSPQGRTAWLRRPYAGEADYRGRGTLTDGQALDMIRRAGAEGVQLLAHCNGDAACAQYLAALETAVREGVDLAAMRPVMIHAQLLGRDQLPAVKRLGVIPSFFVPTCTTGGTSTGRTWGLTGRTASAPPGPRRSWASPSPSTPTHR